MYPTLLAFLAIAAPAAARLGSDLLSVLDVTADDETWCGKNYQSSDPVEPPGGRYQEPDQSDVPLISFQCGQTIRPFIQGEDDSAASVLVNSPITNLKIAGAVGIDTSSAQDLQVNVTVNGKTVASGSVPLNATRHELALSLNDLEPQAESYNMTCYASAGSQSFQATSLLTYLHPPSKGSVTKLDARTGALLARPATGEAGDYQPIFATGFYTQFGDYLASNLSLISELKDQGYTIIHPVPSFDNLTALDEVLDEMERVGLYLMYDMRHTYQNETAVQEEINRIKNRPNLLLWYTADEPDGTSDPLNATLQASNLITSLDGGDGKGGAAYHPVSLVLNCQNYYFTEYVSGADIILEDAYPIGINATWSTQWNTECTPDFGDCGCDNCKGVMEDISDRIDTFNTRIFNNGWDLTKHVWAVPQAFGNETYWSRIPTGQEFLIESILSINHGVGGIVPWDDPTSADIKSAGSLLAEALPTIGKYKFNPAATRKQVTLSRVDIGLWTVDAETMVLATNMNNDTAQVNLQDIGINSGGSISEVITSGGSVDSGVITLDPLGSVGVIIKS